MANEDKVAPEVDENQLSLDIPANNPHPVDEDPEDHLGEEILDPWDDPNQTDWPQNPEISPEA